MGCIQNFEGVNYETLNENARGIWVVVEGGGVTFFTAVTNFLVSIQEPYFAMDDLWSKSKKS